MVLSRLVKRTLPIGHASFTEWTVLSGLVPNLPEIVANDSDFAFLDSLRHNAKEFALEFASK